MSAGIELDRTLNEMPDVESVIAKFDPPHTLFTEAELRAKGKAAKGILKSFPGHAGRPGKVGGSQPANHNRVVAQVSDEDPVGYYLRKPKSFGDMSVYEISDARRLAQDYELAMVAVHGNKIYASKNRNLDHIQLIKAIDPTKNEDDFVRLNGYTDHQGKQGFMIDVLTVPLSKASSAFSNNDELLTDIASTITGALNKLTDKGLPANTPIKIWGQIMQDSIEITAKEYIEKSFPGHKGRPGLEGGAMPRGYEFKPPAMPQQLERGTAGQREGRQRERIAIMKATYPGIEFSQATYNPLGLDYAKREGKLAPGLNVPQAIMDFKVEQVTGNDTVKAVIAANHKWAGSSGYTRLNTLKFETGLDFKTVFGVLNYLRAKDPYKISFSVDRLGKGTAVKIMFDSNAFD